MLTISHAADDGTLIDGTARGDGTAEVLKRCGWRWSARLGFWYVPHSRDRAPKVAQIESTARQLRAAGFEVELVVDATLRSTAEVEASKAERQAARVESLEAKVERARAAEEVVHAGFQAALNGLPAGGEPIKVGHHSEGRHRRAVARADRAWDKWSAATTGMRQAVDAARAATGGFGRSDLLGWRRAIRVQRPSHGSPFTKPLTPRQAAPNSGATRSKKPSHPPCYSRPRRPLTGPREYCKHGIPIWRRRPP